MGHTYYGYAYRDYALYGYTYCTIWLCSHTVAILTKASAPWAALRRARVRTIYYQTEPILVSSPAAGGARHGAAARWCMVSKVRSAVS